MKNYPIVKSIGRHVIAGASGGDVRLDIGDESGGFTLMACLAIPGCGQVAVFEDLDVKGAIVYISPRGVELELEKALEPTKADKEGYYLGYSLEEVLTSPKDILGQKILEQGGDPDFETVRGCFPPIRGMNYYVRGGWIDEQPHTYIGSIGNIDVIPLFYHPEHGYARINYCFAAPEIAEAAQGGDIWEGLIGGWLPVVRYVYYMEDGAYWEVISYAKTRYDNPLIQPAWYRFAKIKNGKLLDIHYYDSYLPYPLDEEPGPEGFYRDLYYLKMDWEKAVPEGMKINIPEQWIVDFCKHSFALEMFTRIGDHPRYGLYNKDYGAPDHDGFMDVLTSAVECYLEWGMTDVARRYLDYYFRHFIRVDGSVMYRGPSLGRYAKILAELAQYYHYTGDSGLIITHEQKIRAIIKILMNRRNASKKHPEDSPLYGMVPGRNEADMSFTRGAHSFAHIDPPYFSVSAGTWRGFRDLGEVYVQIGEKHGLEDYITCGRGLIDEAAGINRDLAVSMKRSLLFDRGRAFLPTIAGSKNYYYDYRGRSCPDAFDNNREWSEIMHAGNVPKEMLDIILTDAYDNQSMKMGMFGTRRFATPFICFGEAYGLIQHDMIREFLLFFYTDILHHHTRGTWTSFECVDFDRDNAQSTSYSTPSQMLVPVITKWMLVFEDPLDETLWLAKATPREWLKNGKEISVENAPVRGGLVNYRITSHVDDGRLEASVTLPAGFEGKSVLRLRLPDEMVIQKILIGNDEWKNYNPSSGDIVLPVMPGETKLDIFVNRGL